MGKLFCFSKKSFSFLFFLLLSLPVFPQTVSLNSGIYEVYLGDKLEINMRLENINTIPRIEFPNIKNLYFSASDRAKSFNYTSIINGKITRSQGIEVTILITPNALGEYKVPGIFYYNKKNQREQTKGFAILVLKPEESDAMFTEIVSTKKKYYQGEKIYLDLRWYLKKEVTNYKVQFPLLEKKDYYQLKNIPIPNNRRKQYFQFSPLDSIPFQVTTEQRSTLR